MKSTILFLVFLNIYATLASEESPVTCASEGEACVIHNDSLLDEFRGVATVEECRQLCHDTEGCEYLTYFNASGDPYQEVCYTFSSCEETYSCTNCVSETESCYAVCGLQYNGESHRSLMFTKPGLDITVTAPPFVSSECQLRVLAIGGGGSGVGGGGGSGYIQFYSRTLTADTFISLTVGDPNQSSSVKINGRTVRAYPGHDGNGYSGAGGYSGGGGLGHYGYDRGCDGGTDGGDGEDCDYGYGGRGTGDDVTAYNMDNFVLMPGAGGKYYYNFTISNYRYGGGGGGVLVNGDGPQRYSDIQGEGYGGGGGPHKVSGVWHYDGLPGVILMEVEEH